MKKILLLASALILSSCDDPATATKALEYMGMTNIQTNGYVWFACSKDDFFHTSFTATNPQGRKIEGTVCNGLLFKNATVRFN